MNNIKQRITNLSLTAHIILAIVTFIVFRVANMILDVSYARSQFPVPFQVGQTAFQGELIKSYYQTMIDAGTLSIYWQTQLIDYGFIMSLFAVGLVLPLLLRRAVRPNSRPFHIISWAATLIPLGALFDATENLISFAMLAQPLTFPNWIAPIYSTFAVLKFAAIGTGYLCVAIGLIWALLAQGWQQFSVRIA